MTERIRIAEEENSDRQEVNVLRGRSLMHMRRSGV